MPDKLFGDDSNLAHLVDESFKQWQASRQRAGGEPASGEVRPYIAISRVVGGFDEQVAELIGRKLGWPVLDRQILDAMAGSDENRRRIYGSMDERDLSWIEEATRAFIETGFDRNDYFHRLVNALFALARGSSAVFVGRGAGWILPPGRGLRVRLVAAPDTCAHNYAARRKLELGAARKEVGRLEHERIEFVRRHFKFDLNDPTQYDLMLNLDRFSPPQAADLVIAAYLIRVKA